MSTNAPKTPLARRKLDADTRASQWLADGNEARECGDAANAEKCYSKSQFWRDRFTLLSNQAATVAPSK